MVDDRLLLARYHSAGVDAKLAQQNALLAPPALAPGTPTFAGTQGSCLLCLEAKEAAAPAVEASPLRHRAH